MTNNDDYFKMIAELCKPTSYGVYQGYMFSKTEVKLLITEAMLWLHKQLENEEGKIDIHDFYKLKGLE